MTEEADTSRPAEPVIEIPPPRPAPRPVGSRARWRSWNEPRVRFWWLSGIVLLVIASWFGMTQGSRWAVERELIALGLKFDAKVTQAAGIKREYYKAPPASPVVLTFVHKGETRTVSGHLQGNRLPIEVGSTIPIRVDPNNLAVWTNRSAPMPLHTYLVGSLVLAPLVAVALAVGFWLRQRKLHTWQHGAPQGAVVVDTHHSAIAPMSRAVRCTPMDSSNAGAGQIVTVFIPHRVADLHRGDTLWLIADVNRPNRVVAAMVYE